MYYRYTFYINVQYEYKVYFLSTRFSQKKMGKGIVARGRGIKGVVGQAR